MQKLLRQLARGVEALWDGECLAAAQLTELGDRLELERLQNLDALGDFFASLTHSQGRLPLGNLVLGDDEDDDVNWPATARDVSGILLDHIAAITALRLSLQGDIPVDPQALLNMLGFDHARAQAFVNKSNLRLAENMYLPPDLPTINGPWQLVVTDDSQIIEMIAPYARDVAGSIDAYAQSLGIVIRGDDDRYRLIPQLMRENPELLRERLIQEQGSGISRPHPSVVVIDTKKIDLAAVDPRLRNALTGLKRRGFYVVITAAQGPALDAVLDAAEQAPEQCWLLAELPAAGNKIFSPRRLYTAGGHHIELNSGASQPLGENLDRQFSVEEHPALFSCSAWPAWRHVQSGLGQGDDTLDSQILGAAYRPALQLLWTEEDEGACWDWEQAPSVACVVSGSEAMIDCGLAMWRALAAQPRRGR